MFFLIIFQWIENHINRCDSRTVVRCDPAVKKTAIIFFDLEIFVYICNKTTIQWKSPI